MPTKTKKPENRTGVLEERIRTLAQQRQQASDAITLAEQRTEQIAARQREIAVAVVSEDEEAVRENDELEEALLIENRRRSTARSAVQQLDAELEQTREALAAEERREHLAAYYRLAADRYALEEEAEAQMAALLNTLEELKRIDVRQRQQSARAGDENAQRTQPIRFLLADWLGAWLGGVEGYLDSSISPTFKERSLPELDGLASEATPGRSTPSNQS